MYKVANYKGVQLSPSESPSSGQFCHRDVAMLWINKLCGCCGKKTF